MRIDKDNIKIILILLVVCLTLGYAYINSDLNINGTARVNHANWDVHWANIQVKNGSVTGSNVVTAPTISNQTTVNYSIILSTPGDYYEFTVDAVNAGVIDAMIDTIDTKLNGTTITTLPAYLNYTITYSDGLELEQNHLLAANTTETYKVRLEYRTDIEINQLPTTNQTLSLSFTVTYRQADNRATEVVRYLYGVSNGDYIHIGSPSSEIQNGEESPPENISYTDSFFRYNIRNNEIVGIDLGFVKNENYYYLKTGGATKLYNEEWDYYYYLNDSPYYEQNKQTLISAFGSENCEEFIDEVLEEGDIPYKTFSCNIQSSYTSGSASDIGAVHVSTSSGGCSYYNEEAACNWVE